MSKAQRFYSLGLFLASLSLFIASPCVAQPWSTEFAGPFLSGPVEEMVAFNGGLVARGAFTLPGSFPQNKLGRWTGERWEQFPGRFDGPVKHLMVLNGDLYAAGEFTRVDNRNVRGIARWTGTGWVDLARGFAGTVTDLAAHQGQPMVCGDLVSAGNGLHGQAATWDGSAWTMLEGGPNFGAPDFIASDGQDIFIIKSDSLYSWAVTSWAPMGPVVSRGIIRDFLFAQGMLLVAGDIDFGVLRWNGSAWATVGSLGSLSRFIRLVELDGALFALGSRLQQGTQTFDGVFSWTGADWLATGPWIRYPEVLTLSRLDGRLVAGGSFREVVTEPCSRYTAVLEGGTWRALESLQPGMNVLNGPVTALAYGHGNLFVAGNFTMAGDAPALNVARWNGIEWQPLGEGIPGEVHALKVLHGVLYAGGSFTSAGGQPASRIAAWDGAQWREVGGGVSTVVWSFDELAGNLLVGGAFHLAGGSIDTPCGIARWDGSAWHALGTNLIGDTRTVLVHEGQAYAAGSYGPDPYNRSTYLVRWNGSEWTSMGTFRKMLCNLFGCWSVAGEVFTLAGVGDRIYAGGYFDDVGDSDSQNIAYYSNFEWHDMPDFGGVTFYVDGPDEAHINSLAVFQGDLIATGLFRYAGENWMDGLVRWSGNEWMPFGPMGDDMGNALLVAGNNLYVGGAFCEVDHTPSVSVARYGAGPVPVVLSSFVARREEGKARITWTTTDAPGVAVYHVYREEPGRERLRITNAPMSGGPEFAFLDPDAPLGEAQYWLEMLARDGESSWYGPAVLERDASFHLRVEQSRPNPFTSTTTIRFWIPEDSAASVQVFDLSGRLVATPLEGHLPAGSGEVTWDGLGADSLPVPDGIYFYSVRTGQESVSGKLLKSH